MQPRRAAFVLLLIGRLCAAQAPQADTDSHWVGTWGTAQQLAAETLPPWVVPPPREPNEPPPPPLLPPYPRAFTDETVRMIAYNATIPGPLCPAWICWVINLSRQPMGKVAVSTWTPSA